MKQRKIFLGIGVPRQAARRLAQRVEKWRGLPMRFAKEGNYHVTLLFLGYVLDEAVADTCFRVEEATRDLEPFDILLDRIELAPEQGRDAKMLWLTGEASEELRRLHEAMEKALGMFSAEKKRFQPHVTLARVRKTHWQKRSDCPTISETTAISIPVDAVTVFESVFIPGKGLVYEPLGEYPLGQ
jgi:2'-5' RNA ligase